MQNAHSKRHTRDTHTSEGLGVWGLGQGEGASNAATTPWPQNCQAG